MSPLPPHQTQGARQGFALRQGAALAVLCLGFAATPADAGQNRFQPPEGCTGFLTVQQRGCILSNHYTCERDPAGDRWRADFNEGGLSFLSHIDHEGQWVESVETFPTRRDTLEPDPVDPASFSELIETGHDSFHFAQIGSDGERLEYAGFDRLTGRTVEIDGITLEETEFEYTELGVDGAELRRGYGQELIHRDWRLFFSGPTNWVTPEETYTSDNSPVKFIFPDEPGFFGVTPIFGCGSTLSGLSRPMGTTNGAIDG